MKIGIVGPNKIFDGNIDSRESAIEKVAKIIAKSGNEIVLTPDKDSLLVYFGQKYLENGGKKIWLIIPTDDPNHESYLDCKLGEIISCKDWDRQADEYNRQSDIFVCIGYAWGGMKEIACAQYFKNKDIYIIKEFISKELPDELNFLVKYISIKDLENIF